MVKNLPASAGNLKDMHLILGSGRSPGEGHGNPLQYSRLEHPMDKKPDRCGPRGCKRQDVTVETEQVALTPLELLRNNFSFQEHNST